MASAVVLGGISCNGSPCRATFRTKCSFDVAENKRRLIGRIRERIASGVVGMSPSAYDTAWVSMVPSTDHKKPRFGECLEWIMENQNQDGSWGLNPDRPDLIKDSLSCTLACLLALHKWNVGQTLVHRGLDFMAANAWSLTDEDQISPVGFDVIFSGMVELANEVSFSLPLDSGLVKTLLDIRASRMGQNHEYAAEGLGSSCNWNAIIAAGRRSNGSLFNSPATTAAALIHLHDDKCAEYLISAVKACDGCVPTLYPVDTRSHLAMADRLEKLGVDKYFEGNLGAIFDRVYRGWMMRDDELFSDVSIRASAFRLLRKRGYDVSSEELAEYLEREDCFKKVGMQCNLLRSIHELYQASKMRIHEEEEVLERIHSWTGLFQEQELSNKRVPLPDASLAKQVLINT